MRRYQLYIEDILGSIDKINRYINGMNKNEFVANELVVDAVLRNIVIYEYFGVDLDIIENYYCKSTCKSTWKQKGRFFLFQKLARESLFLFTI
ncbi:MAG: hypothetical protein PWQ82_1695 [Thermosediminibacterales bacterium]|nr:hypothetical protein [Thermosediminibacterales bacterium]MDK2836662.1 hypothetical protein [Thermosediminibacterales bacterium]